MSTHCRRCNRVLKNPIAVKNGIGFVCARKEQIEKSFKQNESDTDKIVHYDGGDIWVRRLQPGRTTVSDLETNVQRSLYRHSPTGFNFGYAGSGPADLALNICRMFAANPDDADGIYQTFKFRFCGASGDANGRLTIPVSDIENFFREHGVTFRNPAIFAQTKLSFG